MRAVVCIDNTIPVEVPRVKLGSPVPTCCPRAAATSSPVPDPIEPGGPRPMQPGLGAALRKLRERRTLSIRELGRLADVDHAYIYRLEQGEKTSPSAELIATLLSVLKANPRDCVM